MKRQQEEEAAQGWRSVGNKYVCGSCIEEESLAQLVQARADRHRCDYCGREDQGQPISARVDLLVGCIAESLATEYGDPNEELPFDSAEGGYQGDVLDLQNVLNQEDCAFHDKALWSDVVGAFGGRQWCKRNYFRMSSDQALLAGWTEFSDQVMHRTRYLFLAARDMTVSQLEPNLLGPAATLAQIGKAVTEAGQVVTSKAGARWFRARAHSVGDIPHGAAELGSPPLEHASANRMSPAGISMFYGARDEATAIEEVTSVLQNARFPLVTVGTFATIAECLLVDLTNLRAVPSLFDEANRHRRPAIKFLHAFVESVSRPIARDGREHVDYVPTQVVTEYFRRVFTADGGKQIAGILYPSARSKDGVCCVLFVDNGACCDGWSEGSRDIQNGLVLESAMTQVAYPGYTAFLESADLAILRRDGLQVLGRVQQFRPDEWAEFALSASLTPEYADYCQRCREVGARYGLAEWIVRRACLQSDYHPESEPFVIEANFPRATVVVAADSDPLFLAWLSHEAWGLGLRVVHRSGDSEAVVVSVPFPARPREPLSEEHRPPINTAFSVRIGIAPTYPPAAAGEIAREVQIPIQELLRRLGYKAND